MIRSVSIAFAMAGMLCGSAFADTIAINQASIAGAAGAGGFHTVSIDGVSCRVKNSQSVPGASAGCNYTLTLSGIDAMGKGGTWTVTPQQQNGCSTSCEK